MFRVHKICILRLIFNNYVKRHIAIESIAQHGSLHKASEYLNISQPSLSVKIKNLEEALGFKLLNRSTKGIQLTAPGHKVYDYVQEIIRLTNQLQVSLSNTDSAFEGVIRLGIYESIAKYFWPDFHPKNSLQLPMQTVDTYNFSGKKALV